MTVTAFRSRQDDRPRTVAAVWEKWHGNLEKLIQIRERAGDDFSDYAAIQLSAMDEFVVDLQLALFGSDGHGRPGMPSVVVLIRRRKPQIPGQQKLFEMKEAA